jgi:chemotaxis protein MotA
MSANLMWLPLANKLKRMSAVEVAHRELIAQGVLAIQAGVSPRAVGERLKRHLAPTVRESVGAKDKAA